MIEARGNPRGRAVRPILTWLIAWVLGGAVASAHASPRTDPTVGRAVFTGATMPHATSIGLDPAALGLGEANEVYVAITSVIDQLHINLDRFQAQGLQAPGARVRDVELSPGAMLAVIYHLAGDRGTLGFEARTNPPETFPAAGDALRYHTLGGGERDWLASVAASIKVTGDLFFGASLSHQNTFLRLRYARDTAIENGDSAASGVASPCGDAACGLGNPLAAERYAVDVRSPWLSTANLRVNVGAVVQIVRDVWLGVAYHTPPGFAVQSELAGHVDVVRAPRDTPPATPDNPHPEQLRGQSVVEIQFPASVDAELRARLPHGLALHLAGRWEDLSRLSSYDVRTYGSTLPRNGIPEWTERPRGMHDSFAGWGGVEQVEGGPPHVLFGARLGIESSSISTERTSPITIAPASLSLDVGAHRRFLNGVTIEASYGLQYFPTVSVKDSAFRPDAWIACMRSGYDYTQPACETVREGYAIAPAAGTYERLEHALRIGLRYELP